MQALRPASAPTMRSRRAARMARKSDSASWRRSMGYSPESRRQGRWCSSLSSAWADRHRNRKFTRDWSLCYWSQAALGQCTRPSHPRGPTRQPVGVLRPGWDNALGGDNQRPLPTRFPGKRRSISALRRYGPPWRTNSRGHSEFQYAHRSRPWTLRGVLDRDARSDCSVRARVYAGGEPYERADRSAADICFRSPQ